MKLYYAPGACSLAPHIALNESDLPYELARVDLTKHTLEDGGDYYKVNPKGYVPLLVLDDGSKLTEAAVVLQYIADRRPGTLAPTPGGKERYQLMEWLNFIATEIHKGFGPLWDPSTPDATQESARAKLAKRFGTVEETLAKRAYLTGESFSIADIYLFTIANWAGMLKVDLTPFPKLQAFMARVAARPKVHAALKQEGLIKQ
ncbi:MAG: glutathione transferase GstA [Betaproteobacteria bacterium]